MSVTADKLSSLRIPVFLLVILFAFSLLITWVSGENLRDQLEKQVEEQYKVELHLLKRQFFDHAIVEDFAGAMSRIQTFIESDAHVRKFRITDSSGINFYSLDLPYSDGSLKLTDNLKLNGSQTLQFEIGIDLSFISDQVRNTQIYYITGLLIIIVPLTLVMWWIVNIVGLRPLRITQQELQKALGVAEDANRAKSTFLAKMSHELRTPMHAILSFSNLGLKRNQDEKIEHYLQNIRTSGIRLTSLLNDLLDMSKLEAGKMKADFIEQDVKTLIIDTIAQVDSLLSEKSISIQLNTDKSFDCMIDQKLMIQVLVNLFSNAIKFSPKNSIICVDIKSMEAQLDNKYQQIIEITVSDEGVGIPKDQLKSIFDPFVQSRNTGQNSQGTGLGLPITRQIIDLHHGKIWAESPPREKTKGTVIFIQIPVEQAVN